MFKESSSYATRACPVRRLCNQRSLSLPFIIFHRDPPHVRRSAEALLDISPVCVALQVAEYKSQGGKSTLRCHLDITDESGWLHQQGGQDTNAKPEHPVYRCFTSTVYNRVLEWVRMCSETLATEIALSMQGHRCTSEFLRILKKIASHFRLTSLEFPSVQMWQLKTREAWLLSSAGAATCEMHQQVREPMSPRNIPWTSRCWPPVLRNRVNPSIAVTA